MWTGSLCGTVWVSVPCSKPNVRNGKWILWMNDANPWCRSKTLVLWLVLRLIYPSFFFNLYRSQHFQNISTSVLTLGMMGLTSDNTVTRGNSTSFLMPLNLHPVPARFLSSCSTVVLVSPCPLARRHSIYIYFTYYHHNIMPFTELSSLWVFAGLAWNGSYKAQHWQRYW